MIYHVQYNSGNGWQGIDGDYVYITADTAAEAMARIKPMIADSMQAAARERIAAARTYQSEAIPDWESCYKTAETYSYRYREIHTDGHGDTTVTDWTKK